MESPEEDRLRAELRERIDRLRQAYADAHEAIRRAKRTGVDWEHHFGSLDQLRRRQAQPALAEDPPS